MLCEVKRPTEDELQNSFGHLVSTECFRSTFVVPNVIKFAKFRGTTEVIKCYVNCE